MSKGKVRIQNGEGGGDKSTRGGRVIEIEGATVKKGGRAKTEGKNKR